MRIIMRHKYPAFTILELMVVMLLTVLTISLAYRVYEMFTKMFLQYKQHSYRMTELTSFQRTLSHDMHKAESVIKTSGGLRCISDTSVVVYNFQDKYILRNSSKIDTFYLDVLESIYIYEEKEQYLEEAPLDFYQILLLSNKDSVTLSFTKPYGADQRLRFKEKYGYQEN